MCKCAHGLLRLVLVCHHNPPPQLVVPQTTLSAMRFAPGKQEHLQRLRNSRIQVTMRRLPCLSAWLLFCTAFLCPFWAAVAECIVWGCLCAQSGTRVHGARQGLPAACVRHQSAGRVFRCGVMVLSMLCVLFKCWPHHDRVCVCVRAWVRVCVCVRACVRVQPRHYCIKWARLWFWT